MENRIISYYDLLTLLKYNQQPKKVKLTTEDGEGIFEWSDEYKRYYATNSEEILQKYGMSSEMFENIYEPEAFEKCIEIIEKSNNDIKLSEYRNNNNFNVLSYYDLLSLVKQKVIPKRVLVNSNGYLAHYEYSDDVGYSIVFDELYDGEDFGVHWDSFLNHELNYCLFEPCIKIMD